MRHLTLITILTMSILGNAATCPSKLLVKKHGAKTLYTSDLKTKYSLKELDKFGCNVVAEVMTKEQNIKLIDDEATAKKSKL